MASRGSVAPLAIAVRPRRRHTARPGGGCAMGEVLRGPRPPALQDELQRRTRATKALEPQWLRHRAHEDKPSGRLIGNAESERRRMRRSSFDYNSPPQRSVDLNGAYAVPDETQRSSVAELSLLPGRPRSPHDNHEDSRTRSERPVRVQLHCSALGTRHSTKERGQRTTRERHTIHPLFRLRPRDWRAKRPHARKPSARDFRHIEVEMQCMYVRGKPTHMHTCRSPHT